MGGAVEPIRDQGGSRGGTAEFRSAKGIDLPAERRPGVPKEARPEPDPGASWDEPPRQESEGRHFHRASLDQLTPVHGTAQPPRGLSGVIRGAAYKLPEHTTRHWALLLAADRVDVLEDRLRHGVPASALDARVRRLRTNPLPLIVAGVVAGLVVRRALRAR